MKEENVNGGTGIDDTPKKINKGDVAKAELTLRSGAMLLVAVGLGLALIRFFFGAYNQGEISVDGYKALVGMIELDGRGPVKDLIHRAMEDQVITREEYLAIIDNNNPIIKAKAELVKKLKE
jgi:hypothetical protein